ncbi:hypothetical protein BGZ76_003073 [Entomortierella beljakovae]|nr:hypothetical protein BGZ76_003073 [Entomortierella beljakovae]
MVLGLPGPGFEFSERDCLNLNVFSPRCTQHVPVICYIHGGITHGGNALPVYDAANIVKKSIEKDSPVVVVTINYRLLPNAGLLESSSNKGGNERYEKVIDMRLHDQKLALEWIKKHIHNFGGNPNEITLMGHSSGESSEGYHLLDAQSDGLFKRAIMHSESKYNSRKSNEPQDCSGSSLSLNRIEKKGDDMTNQFTFMADACLPYMSEGEKQAGNRVIDRWIDFAWGKK